MLLTLPRGGPKYTMLHADGSITLNHGGFTTIAPGVGSAMSVLHSFQVNKFDQNCVGHRGISHQDSIMTGKSNKLCPKPGASQVPFARCIFKDELGEQHETGFNMAFPMEISCDLGQPSIISSDIHQNVRDISLENDVGMKLTVQNPRITLYR